MNKIFGLKKFIPSLPIVISVIIFIITLQLSSCEYPSDLLFDTQNIFYWKFLNKLGVVAFRDIFYPHGLITFYASSRLLFKFIYVVLPSIYFLIIYQVLYSLFGRSRKVTWVLINFYYLIILNFVNLNAYIRYGLLIYPAIFSGYLLTALKGSIKHLLLGLIAGFVLFLELGIGINLLIVNIFLLLFDGYYHLNSKKTFNFHVFRKRIIYFMSGLGLGLLPFIFFMVKYGVLTEMPFFIKDILSVSSYAKSEVYFRNRGNLLILFVFFANVTVMINSIKSGFSSKRKLYLYLLISSFLATFLLILKFAVRQMTGPMIIQSILNLIIILYPLYTLFKKKYKHKGDAFFILSAAVLFLLFIYSVVGSWTIAERITGTRTFFKEYKWPYKDPLLCKIDNLDQGFLYSDPDYKNIYEYLQGEQNGQNIFLYPNDPIFYIYFKQKPPPYPTTWESSPEYAQLENIEYIKKNNINVIVYNVKYLVHDQVPNYVRNKTLHTYLMTNYHPVYKNEDFVVMEKNEDDDYYFLHDTELLREYWDLFDKNLNVNFNEVFYLEGKYKTGEFLTNSVEIVRTSDINKVRDAINENNDELENLVLLIKYSDEKRSSTRLTFLSDNEIETRVSYKMCGEYYCLIKLSNIPLLYHNNLIKIIETEHVPQGFILLHTSDDNNLW